MMIKNCAVVQLVLIYLILLQCTLISSLKSFNFNRPCHLVNLEPSQHSHHICHKIYHIDSFIGISVTAIHARGFRSKSIGDFDKNICSYSNNDADVTCPCGSNIFYATCCKPYHDNKAYPQGIVSLVRSRFSAYAIKPTLSQYIMDSTHPSHVEYVAADNRGKRKVWERKIKEFGMANNFECLTFMGDIDPSTSSTARDVATTEASILFKVSYKPIESKKSKVLEFTEQSIFKLSEDMQWKYASGIIIQ